MNLLGKCTQIRTHTHKIDIYIHTIYLCYDDPKVDRICFHPKNHFNFVMILQKPYHIFSRMTLPPSLSVCIGRKLKIYFIQSWQKYYIVLLHVLHTRPMVACFKLGHCRPHFRLSSSAPVFHGRLYKWDHSRQIIGEALAATSVVHSGGPRWIR